MLLELTYVIMTYQEKYSGYKLEVLCKLRNRNTIERERYEDVVHLTNNLYESLDYYQKENVRLRVRKANLEHDLDPDAVSANQSDRASIDAKTFLLQQELAEMHKQKGEFALQVVTLRNSLDEKEKEMVVKNKLIQDLEESLKNSEQLCKRLQLKLSETEYNLQFLKDEHDALRITYTSIEKKRQKLENENQDLIARLIVLKAEDADRMNAETESFMKKKQAKLQKELEEAAKEPASIDPGKLKLAVCLDAILPRKAQYKFDAHEGEVNAIAWMRTDARFATGGGDHRVKIWDITAGAPTLKGVASESNSSVCSVDFDTEENLVLAASCDFACRVWSLNDMKIKHTLTGHAGKVMSAKFLGDFGQVVSGSHDRTMKLWDLRRRTCTRTILAGSSVNDVVTSGNSIVSGHFDRKIRYWDIRSDSSTNEILLQGRITSLDLSLDGNYLLSCIRDDSLKLIDFRMHQVIKTFSADGFLIGCDWTRAKFSPDGQFCVCGSQDGSIIIWKIMSGNVEKVLKEHHATVIACSWSWCGNYLLSCDKNKRAILWTEF